MKFLTHQYLYQIKIWLQRVSITEDITSIDSAEINILCQHLQQKLQLPDEPGDPAEEVHAPAGSGHQPPGQGPGPAGTGQLLLLLHLLPDESPATEVQGLKWGMSVFHRLLASWLALYSEEL